MYTKLSLSAWYCDSCNVDSALAVVIQCHSNPYFLIMDLSLKWIRKYFLITARVILWQFVILSKTTNLPVNTFCRVHWVKCTYFEWMKHTAKRLRFDRYLCDDSLFYAQNTQRVFFINATFSDKFSFLIWKELHRTYPSKIWAKIFIAKLSGVEIGFALQITSMISFEIDSRSLSYKIPHQFSNL